jgi:hypothetical protein
VSRRAERHARASLELRILDLASRSGGELYATDVARSLGISSAEADAALTHLADGTRVTVDVTDEGLVKYVFRELRTRATNPRIRVADPGVESVEEVERVDQSTGASADRANRGEPDR